MRIAMVAMSGVRVQNEALMKAGLTMPGFLERSEVIASLPSLSLLTLAALTPRDVEVEYFEIAELGGDTAWSAVRPPETARRAVPPGDFDLVAISTMSAQAPEAYRVADLARLANIPVVMGGLHATACPDEVLEHADAVVVGEGEPVWTRVVEDARRGRMSGVYKASAPFNLADAPMPRFELLDIDKYNRLTVQTSRGCPHKCEFCASSITLTKGYSVKPVEKVIAEVRRIKSIWPKPFIELADDNSFAMRGYAKELLTALAKENVRWFTEADLSIANDDELLSLMREAGCRQVLIGLESPRIEGLSGLETNSDWKLKQFPKAEDAVRKIQRAGITVIGCFILGLDGHTKEVFEDVYECARRTSLYDVQVTVLTPFPGTPLYSRLAREGRLTHPGAWERCTLFDVNYEPVGMSVEELETGLRELVGKLYEPGFVRERREGFFAGLRRAG